MQNQPINIILKKSLKKLKLTIKEFSKLSKLSKSSLYKIMSGKRKDIQVSKFISIINALREIEEGTIIKEKGIVIAIISTRNTLHFVQKFKPKNKKITIKEYPAANIEEAMIQGINAIRDGVKAIICGPITAYTLQKIVDIPIIEIRIEERQIKKAIEEATFHFS